MSWYSRPITRRFLLTATATAGIGAWAARAQEILSVPGISAPADAPAALPEDLVRLMEAAPWEAGRWGLEVVDLDTGEKIVALNTDTKFMTGSTAKIFTVSAALFVLGKDYQFKTPLVHTGTLSGDQLRGDLIMVSSGDFALGGRAAADGTLEIPAFDHTDANAIPGKATITDKDALAGLNQLAQQIADSGIRKIDGEVIVDDRLWDPISINGLPITPTVVNDNLIDLLITPGKAGEKADIDWLPKSAAITIDADVTTAAAGSTPTITTTADETGRLQVRGTVPEDAAAPFIATYQVPDPASFARTLLIEALARHGVQTSADPLGTNPAAALPATTAELPVLATFTSPPFSEYARLVNKISHNLGSNMLAPLIAVQRGQRTYAAGMNIVRDYLLEEIGLAPDSFSLPDAQGLPDDQATPRAQTDLLRALVDRPEASVLVTTMPVIGVDGSLSDVIAPDNPAVGKVKAKTGTLVGPVNGKLGLMTKALAGYVDAKSGRQLAFALYLNDVPSKSEEVSDAIDLALEANRHLGEIAASLYLNN